MKTKIYLAKSNRANPDHITMVRKTLSGFEVEVVEFIGGAYSHKPLLKCDMLIILPELGNDAEEEAEGYFPFGKGLHEQYFAFNTDMTNKCDILMVTECDDVCGATVGMIDDIEFGDTDDYVNYSIACVDRDGEGPLRDAIENRCGLSTTSTRNSSLSRYKLLLTKS